jgi:hypothetical protein
MSKKIGRPSTAKKKLKDGYYLEVLLKDAVKPIRILRETKEGLEQAKDQFKNHKVKYIGQVKSNLWLDGDHKGKKTA